MKNVVVYHTSRGGQFNNEGFKRCKGIVEGFDADYYGINLYYTFENLTTEIFEQLEELRIEVIDLSSDWSEEHQVYFNEQVISGIDGKILKAEDLGEPQMVDEAGNYVGTVESYQSNSGTLEIDGLYDRWEWKELKDLDVDELAILLRDLQTNEYEEHIFEMGLDQDVYELIRHKTTADDLAGIIYHKVLFKELKQWYDLREYKNEDEANEEGYFHGRLINGIYYVLD